MLSKKDYFELGRLIARSKDKGDMEERLKSFLKEDNPRFNKEKFENYIESLKMKDKGDFT